MIKRILITTFLLNLFLIASAQYPAYINSFRIAGPNGDIGEGIGVDAAGNVYVAGSFGINCDFDPNGQSIMSPSAGTDLFIAKYTSAGGLIWKYSIGGNGSEFFNNFKVDADGNIYMLGYYYTSLTATGLSGNLTVTSNGNADAFLVKYNSNGELKSLTSIGGSDSEAFSALLEDSITGDLYITGYYASTQIDIDPGAGQVILNNTTPVGVNNNPFIVKYDSSLNYIWALNMRNMNSGDFSAISMDASGRIILGGYFSGTMLMDTAGTPILATGGIDNIILRLTSNGMYDNSWTFGGANADFLMGLVATGNDIVATGIFMGTTDLDPGSGSNIATSAGNNDIYLVKLDQNGTFQWGGSIKGSLNDYVLGMTSNQAGEIYITGFYNYSASFDLTTNGGVQPAYSGKDGYLAKYSPSGTLIAAMPLGGDGGDEGHAVVHTGNGEFLVTGFYTNNPMHVDPSQPATMLSNVGSFDVFVGRYSDNLATGVASLHPDEIKVSPVPAGDYINLELKNTGDYTANILDLSGRVVSNETIPFTNSIRISTSTLRSGIYFIAVSNHKSEPAYYRFIKQ